MPESKDPRDPALHAAAVLAIRLAEELGEGRLVGAHAALEPGDMEGEERGAEPGAAGECEAREEGEMAEGHGNGHPAIRTGGGRASPGGPPAPTPAPPP